MLGRKTAVKCDFCGEPIVNHLWIECNKCMKWFHVSCLSLSDVELKTIKTRSFNCKWCMGTCETLEAKSNGIIEELDNGNNLNSVKSSLENMKTGFSTYFGDVKRAIARVEASVFEKLADLVEKSTILQDRKRPISDKEDDYLPQIKDEAIPHKYRKQSEELFGVEGDSAYNSPEVVPEKSSPDGGSPRIYRGQIIALFGSDSGRTSHLSSNFYDVEDGLTQIKNEEIPLKCRKPSEESSGVEGDSAYNSLEVAPEEPYTDGGSPSKYRGQIIDFFGSDGEGACNSLLAITGDSNKMLPSQLSSTFYDVEDDLPGIKHEGISHQSRMESDDSFGVDVLGGYKFILAPKEESNKLLPPFFSNVSYAYKSLLLILKYLNREELCRAASVCRLWRLVVKDTSLWKSVHVRDTQIYNWSVFIAALRCGDTRHLDLRNMLHVCDDWNKFCENIGTVCSLESIYLSRCPAYVVERLFQVSQNLRIVNAFDINDDSISIENVALLCGLEELHISTCQPVTLNGDLHALASLTKLTHLTLTSIKGLGDKSVEVLGQLTTLKSLELGECGDFDYIFTKTVLPKLKNLQRLRLENGIETKVCTLQVLLAVAGMEVLQQLELINFDIPRGFDEMLSLCVNITKLLIAPTYLSKSAITNHLILSGAKQMAETLKVFTWCINYELLYVTGHYMNQCKEIIGKNTYPFDQFIPILKPVPRAFNNYVNLTIEEEPQIEILPLDMMEVILAEILPSTKFNIVKLPYCAMRKQKLIDGAE